jgi:colanic acid/amylovoran biosynthesis glycosyltransferase
MKIAFIVGQFPALSETFILNQITGLIDRGYEVDIYADSPRIENKVHPDIKKYNLLDKCHYRFVPENKLLRLMKGIVIFITNFYKNPKALLQSLNFLKYGKEALSLRPLYTTVSFLNNKSYDYDVVYCHFGPLGNLGAILKDIGVIKGKVVTTFHGHDLSAYLKIEGNNVYNFLFKKGDLFLPISERWKRKLIELGCDEKKILVHRMGIDTRKFEFLPRRYEEGKNLKLLTIARLVEKKGVEYGVRAVAKLLKKYPNIEYRIVGDGPLKKEIEQLIANLNVGEKIKLLGWREQEEITHLLKDTHIFLAPSVTSKDGDQEGIPVVLMEALAMGIPVVTTQHSGIPELVKDGESGYLVPERDVEALAQKLEFLALRPKIWSKMGEAGRKFVERHYDINKLNDKLVNIFDQITQSKQPLEKQFIR